MKKDDDALSLWTVYRYPRDYPDSWVARRIIVRAAQTLMTNDMYIAETLQEIRALLPKGLHRLDRSPHDDPVITEVWL